jgi:exodeoxyribonuclease VII large subunit
VNVLEVSQVTQRIQEVLRADDVLRGFWVRGEIANLSKSAAGHCYFTLCDERAQLRAVLFRSFALRGGVVPENGDVVVAYAETDFYEPSGSLSVKVKLLYPEGTGVQQLELEALKLRLEAEGLFDPARKRSLPAYPRRIGVVTSETGAVLHDIMRVLNRRYPLVEVVLAKATVQGERAPAEICSALSALARHSMLEEPLDLIIVARGGGDSTDLAVFNDERIARAIFGCPVPVVSAIGHEVDVTIADLVADLRAPTPSAAAEMVVPDIRELRFQVVDLAMRGRAAVDRLLERAESALDERRDRLMVCSPRLDIERKTAEVLAALRRGEAAIRARHRVALAELDGRTLQLAALSPLKTLNRGYAICQAEDGNVLRSVEDAPAGTRIDVTLRDGVLESRSEGRKPSREQRDERQTANV